MVNYKQMQLNYLYTAAPEAVSSCSRGGATYGGTGGVEIQKGDRDFVPREKQVELHWTTAIMSKSGEQMG